MAYKVKVARGANQKPFRVTNHRLLSAAKAEADKMRRHGGYTVRVVKVK